MDTRITLSALALLLGSGCGAGALSAQSSAVLITSRVVAEADTVIVATEAADLDRVEEDARRTCAGAPCNEAQATAIRARLDEREASWDRVLQCRAPIVGGVRSWVAAIRDGVALGNDDLSWSAALAWGRRALVLYDEFVTCVERASDLEISLPRIPAFVMDLVRGEAQ